MQPSKLRSYYVRRLSQVLLMAGMYFILARVSLIYDFTHSAFSPIWLPSGFGLAMVFLYGGFLAAGIWLGGMAAELHVLGHGDLPLAAQWSLAGSVGMVDALQALIGAAFLKRFLRSNSPLFRVSDVFIFIAAAVLASVVSATLSTVLFCSYLAAPWDYFQSVLFNRWCTELAGVITVAPLVWICCKVPFGLTGSRKLIEGLFWFLCVLGASISIFSGTLRINHVIVSRTFLVFPLIVWFTYRIGYWAVVSAVVSLVVVSTWGTAGGYGPFAGSNFEASLFLLRFFNAVVAVTALTLAAALYEREFVQQELARSHQRFKALIENSLDAVELLSAEGLKMYSSNSVKRLTGYEPNECIGRNIFDFIYPQDRAYVRRELTQALARPGGIVALQCRQVLKDGSIRWFEGTCQNFLDDPLMNAMIINYRDISERKMAEELLKMDKRSLQGLVEERSEALSQTQQELKEASRLADIGTLAATVAHELRNPLGVIQMAAHNLRRKHPNLKMSSHLINIEKKVLEGDQIIDNLLSYSRIKMPAFVKIDMIKILEECLKHAQARFSGQQVKVAREYRHEECVIEADPNQLREVFANILNNAYQAMVETPEGRLELMVDVAPQEARLIVHDNGSGIDAKDVDKVFNPFFTRKPKGTGLGLAICNEIINLHHGRIDVKSKTHCGTSVCMSFPLSQARFLPV